jgi:hypothetical protein
MSTPATVIFLLTDFLVPIACNRTTEKTPSTPLSKAAGPMATVDPCIFDQKNTCVDVRACAPTPPRRHDGPQGSATLQVYGPVDGGCGLCFDTEVEDPRWAWRGCPAPKCIVPQALGSVELPRRSAFWRELRAADAALQHAPSRQVRRRSSLTTERPPSQSRGENASPRSPISILPGPRYCPAIDGVA